MFTLTSTPDKITPEDVAKITSGRPFNSGASRKVFDLGTHVLKLNRSRSHWAGGCAEEIYTWENADDTLRAFLCPIIAADPDGQWLVMPKCEPASDGYNDDYLTVVRTLEDYGIGDQHPGNVMVYTDPETGEERLVSTDYGMLDDRECCRTPETSEPCHCTDCRIDRGSISAPRDTPENWRTFWFPQVDEEKFGDDCRERYYAKLGR